MRVAIDYTPQASAAKIRTRAIYRYNEKYAVRGSGDLKLTYNTGDRGGNATNVWLRSGGKFHIMSGPGKWGSRSAPSGARWPDWLWAQYQALEQQTPEERRRLQKEWIAKAMAARGLARLSWLQVADSLGIEIPGVRESLRNVKGSDGRSYINGRGTDQSGLEALRYELANWMPALTGGLDGEGILARAGATREAAFDIALSKGVFDDIAALRSRYPAVLLS